VGVVVAVAVAGEDFVVVGVVAAALEVFAGVVVAVELVVLELLLPHPAISTPQSSVAASFENRPAVTFSPFDLLSARSSSLDRQRRARSARLSVGTDAGAQIGGPEPPRATRSSASHGVPKRTRSNAPGPAFSASEVFAR
jgi:hypothetical protein